MAKKENVTGSITGGNGKTIWPTSLTEFSNSEWQQGAQTQI